MTNYSHRSYKDRKNIENWLIENILISLNLFLVEMDAVESLQTESDFFLTFFGKSLNLDLYLN